MSYIHLAEQLPTPDDQPSGLDYRNISLPKAKWRSNPADREAPLNFAYGHRVQAPGQGAER